MKWLVSIILGIFFLAGCQQTPLREEVEPSKNRTNVPISDVISVVHKSVENLERLDQFVFNASENKEDRIRLIQHTTEGDPIYYDVSSNGTALSLTIDTTEDQYGTPEVKTYQCNSLKKLETSSETLYKLKDCSPGKEIEILYLSHDVEQEDFFAFQLKYGNNPSVEINTKEDELNIKLSNGESVHVADFQFTTEQLNKIYKLMLYANYLKEKKLTTQCSKNPIEDFELTIWINGGSKQFDWANCDESKDGVLMTKLVENIKQILEETHSYQSIPELKNK